MAREDYVPVAADDWYQRRRDDKEGRFFREVASQGPRTGEGGSTRQGIYCFTADGKLLAYKNAGQAPDVMRETLRQALRDWRRLPEERRLPGAVKVDDLDATDARYTRTPPRGGLIVNVYTRILARDQGELCKGTCKTPGGDQAAHDHLWLTEGEWRSLLPANPSKGQQFPMPAKIAERLLRYHLLDNTRGEPPMWQREDIRASKMTLTVEQVTAGNVRLLLEGSALLATLADVEKAERGFDVRLLGHIHFDLQKNAVNRFDVVAVGDHWGDAVFTRGARPGRQPLGVVFELASGKSAADRVPPQAAREIDAYLGRDR